jgi:hypothetical protein
VYCSHCPVFIFFCIMRQFQIKSCTLSTGFIGHEFSIFSSYVYFRRTKAMRNNCVKSEYQFFVPLSSCFAVGPFSVEFVMNF